MQPHLTNMRAFTTGSLFALAEGLHGHLCNTLSLLQFASTGRGWVGVWPSGWVEVAARGEDKQWYIPISKAYGVGGTHSCSA